MKTLGTMAALALAVLLSGCGESSDPGDVARDAVLAMADNDCEALNEVTDDQLSCGPNGTVVDSWEDEPNALKQTTSRGVDVKSVDEKEDAAIVTLELHGERDDGEPHDMLQDVELIKVEDEWKVPAAAALLASGSLRPSR